MVKSAAASMRRASAVSFDHQDGIVAKSLLEGDRTGEFAKLTIPIHPHMLRHGCGFKLANDGVDTHALQHYLGHRNIMHTVRYTELRSDRFDGFWKD